MSRKQRAYSLIFGLPVIVPDDFFLSPLTRGSNKTLSIEAYYNENDPNAYLIDKHEISFRITKSEKSNNKAEITVSNLSESTVSYLLSNRKKNLAIVFKAGYDEDIKIVFQGTMKDCIVSKSGNTSKTRIIVDDGNLNTTSAYSSRVYQTGTPAKLIVEDFILDMATPKGRIIDLPPSSVITTPYSVMGNSFESLNRFLANYGYVPTINEGMCYILPKDKRMADNVAFISPETGLIGNVQGLILDDKPKNSTDAVTGDKKRIRFTCQLDATLNPQSSVYVQDTEMDVDGAFKIEKATFQSSSFETGTWFVTVDAAEIDATVVV